MTLSGSCDSEVEMGRRAADCDLIVSSRIDSSICLVFVFLNPSRLCGGEILMVKDLQALQCGFFESAETREGRS